MFMKEREELGKCQLCEPNGEKLKFFSKSLLPSSGHSFFPGQKWSPEWLLTLGLNHGAFYRQS